MALRIFDIHLALKDEADVDSSAMLTAGTTVGPAAWLRARTRSRAR